MKQTIFLLLSCLTFTFASAEFLRTGDRIAIVGDSITEQKLYSTYIETYLRACTPQLNVKVIQLGRGGETTQGFTERMDKDLFPWNPTVATFFYGMNDGGYRAFEESTGQTFSNAMSKILTRSVAQNMRVVVGSPGVVDTDTFKRPNVTAEAYNETLAKLGTIARDLATQFNVNFADVHTTMMDAMTTAKLAYGETYHVAGTDGVHPAVNGQLVIAYAFLKGMELDGNLATFTLTWPQDIKATPGHTATAKSDGVVEIVSTRYPYCFFGKAGDPQGTVSIIPYLPFNQDLNRFMLVVKKLPTDKAEVTWGVETKTFSRDDLAKGINLAEEFPNTPFYTPFMKVWQAVKDKQFMETRIFQQILPSLRPGNGIVTTPEEITAAKLLEQACWNRMEEAQATVQAEVQPVTHTITIRPL